MVKGNKVKPSSIRNAKVAVEQNQHLMAKYPNITAILFGCMTVDGRNIPCVDIHINDKNSEPIPAQLPAVNKKGKAASVPVRIFKDIQHARPHAAAGDKITFGSTAAEPGTLGCILTDDTQQYMLTCCHVFTQGAWNPACTGTITNPATDLIVDQNTGESLGQWTFGLMNNSYDIAYSSIPAGTNYKKGVFGSPRDLVDNDVVNHTPVSFVGYSSKLSTGEIVSMNATKTVDYNNAQIPITGLILTAKKNPNNNDTENPYLSMSGAGDSGSLVYTTAENEPIGMVIGGDGNFTYIIPINNILSIVGMGIY
jgi:hypothetical protein